MNFDEIKMKFEKSIKSVKSLDELQIGEIVGVCLDTHKSPLPMICEGYSEDKSYLIFRDVSER